MSKTVQPTAQQRLAAAILKTRLGERGYFIAPVAPFFRRSDLDFVALPKDRPDCMVLVRPTANNTMVVRPFASGQVYVELRSFLKTLRNTLDIPLKFGMPQLPHARQRPDWLSQFVPSECLPELAALGCRLERPQKPQLS